MKNPSTDEHWKDIDGYHGQYQISSHGRVKSLARTYRSAPGHTTVPERIMVQSIHRSGYRCVWLRRPKEHKKFFIHQLVGRAFIPNPLNKPVVNHINRDKEHNHVSNLEWATFAENTQHYRACDKAGVSPPPFKSSDLAFQ